MPLSSSFLQNATGRDVESEEEDVARQRVRFIAGRRPALFYASMSAFLAPQFGCARKHNADFKLHWHRYTVCVVCCRVTPSDLHHTNFEDFGRIGGKGTISTMSLNRV